LLEHLTNEITVVSPDAFEAFLVNFIIIFIAFAVIDSHIALLVHQKVRTVHLLELHFDWLFELV
jgi:hypothetical protein